MCNLNKTGYLTGSFIAHFRVFCYNVGMKRIPPHKFKSGAIRFMGKKNTTFADIAEYTNFSKTTISRYFNNPDSLTLENQEKIRDALVKLDYKKNNISRILANGQTEFVGILIPDLRNSYYSEILREILKSYATYGYKFLVFNGNDEKEVERQYLNELMSYKIEGLLVMSHTLSSQELAALNIPIVSIEREDEFISSVNCDNYMGAVQAVSLLASHSCDVFIHINTPTAKTRPSYQRINGFRDFCEEHQLLYQIMIHDNSVGTNEQKNDLQNILNQVETKFPEKRKGLFFSNDHDANEFLKLLIRKYKTLPPDYRIVGYDGAPISENAVYSISTVGQQIEEIVAETMRLLALQIDERKKRKPLPLSLVHKIITPVLYRRETTELEAD